VLLARSQEIVQQLGFKETPADAAHGFFTDDDYLNYIQERDKSQTRWQRLGSDRPATILFWYRQSPREMQSDNFFNSIGSGVITPWEPPSSVTGMISVFLDTQGRLLFFKRIPPERDPPSGPSPPPDWSSLFSAAGLDPSKFTSATPEWSDLLFPTRERHGLVEIITTDSGHRTCGGRGLPRETGLFPGFCFLGPTRTVTAASCVCSSKVSQYYRIVLFGAVLFGSS